MSLVLKSFASGFIALFSLTTLSQAALVVNSPQTLTHKVVVQPIVVSQDPAQGGATATFFGNSTQKAEIEGYVDTIWAQAGVDVQWLTATTYVSSFAYDGFPDDYTTATRPTSDLSAINDAAGTPPKSSNSSVLNMFFVNIVPGFSYTTLNSANGLAFVGGNGVTQFVGSELLTWAEGREVIASVVAHEIGHNLGLTHNTTDFNLMESGATESGEQINESQISTIQSSPLLQVIPEPSGVVLLGIGVLLIALRRPTRLTCQ